MDVETAVRDRYADGAQARQAKLYCPTDYEPEYLKVIPREVIERDYGCGNPARYLNQGETVLDLGSGTGKICFIAAQVVGAEGRVIGVDMTPEMLEVANRNAPIVADRLGYDNVEFRRGRIQDLALDLDRVDAEVNDLRVHSYEDLLLAEKRANELRMTSPLVDSASVDVVVSNCVLNLVDVESREQLFGEIHRVLRRGGRAVISDIVSDEEIPVEMQQDPELWSGCISGAFTETGFLEAFEETGFYGIHVVERQAEPWQTVDGFEFRSVTIEAFKGKEGACFERNQAVIYRGPFKEVVDDDGHRMTRGERYAVCDKTYQIYGAAPYEGHFERIAPREEIPLEDAGLFDCGRARLRHPRETKGQHYDATTDAAPCCEPGGSG
ncbi:MAG: methyltransferase domain-containing protein [Acidobacteria bacterium]|nr:methyltransferase domain-containing protein [Acidobacteriota bacterium]